jgi:hypothetical protein
MRRIVIDTGNTQENILTKYMNDVDAYGQRLLVLTRTVMDTTQGKDVFKDVPLHTDAKGQYWRVSRKSGYVTTDVRHAYSDILSMLMKQFNKVFLNDVHYTLEPDGDRSNLTATLFRMRLHTVAEFEIDRFMK